VVGRDEIIERAWGRRHLSPNSVAVVIGDLRRALDIPAGESGSIETVPKAGYRLTGGAAETPVKRRGGALPYVLLAIFVTLVLAVIAWRALAARPEVALGLIENSMGTDRYAALMQASNQTVVVELGRHARDLRLIEGPPSGADRPDYILQQRWVLWSGDPELVLVAKDPSGRTIWSGAIYGKENDFPAKISDKIRDFDALVRTAK
jgi:Transcriptional regulatory protein, C terminal